MKSSAAASLERLRDLGIQIELLNANLRIKARPGSVSEELLAHLRILKPDIVRILRRAKDQDGAHDGEGSTRDRALGREDLLEGALYEVVPHRDSVGIPTTALHTGERWELIKRRPGQAGDGLVGWYVDDRGQLVEIVVERGVTRDGRPSAFNLAQHVVAAGG